MSKITRKKVKLPTYSVGKPESLPIFFEKRPYQGASGRIYPIPYSTSISDTKKDVGYDGIIIENKYIRTLLLPEIGGKIHSAYDKTADYDFIYNNKVIKPAMVGLAGPWVSGGIEFNWPQHHRPTTFMPLSARIEEKDGVSTAYMGETDPLCHMKGAVAISVDDKHSYIKASVTVYNSTPVPHPFMWWANMAVEINDDYKVVFPPDVEYVNDHDRRAVLEWPVAKGVYHTARPFDYGKGTDIHNNCEIKVPSSFMVARGQSDMDFVSGYDAGRKCGIVTVADHHIAPGKKLWTWGSGKFGAKWCSNLTDDGSQYVELMTGCYTDNQPDFTWIAPYETKCFEQYWYPVKDIGEIKNATKEGACNIEKRSDGIYIGIYSTCDRKDCRIKVTDSDKNVVYEAVADISPEKTFEATFTSDADFSGLTLTAYDCDGKPFVSYTPVKRGGKKPIDPRLPAAAPETIKTNEELYLNGIHLRQYKHFAYRPEDYFREALRRDEYDVRCNKAMGDIALETGDFDGALGYYSKAIERLTIRNANPYDTEPYYKRALAHFCKGEYDAAYDDAYASIWSYPLRSPGYYLLAKIESLRNDTEKAIEFLGLCLETDPKNLRAIYALGQLRGDETAANEKITELYPLFFEDMNKEKNAIDLVIELCEFGLYEKAKSILEGCEERAMKHYYLAYIYGKLGRSDDAAREIKKADACDWQCEFPSRTESIAVLSYAASARAHYYLGCLLYNFERYEAACDYFRRSVDADDSFAPAHRCLSLGLYDHLSDPEGARVHLEKAFELMPDSNRIFFELTMLYKNLNLPTDERLAFYESHPELTFSRDDCTLALSVLYTVKGDYDKANSVLASHRFHTYEGGEGYLTQHHAWLHFLMGKKLIDAGEYEKAIAVLNDGLTFPENYGEEKNYFVNDAPIYYSLATCYKALGDSENAEKYDLLALSTNGSPTIHSYFQCLALSRLGKNEECADLANDLRRIGNDKIRNAAVNDYYGVGAPAYSPFSYDIVKAHTLAGCQLLGFASLLGGDEEETDRIISKLEAIDVSDFATALLKEMANS